MIHRGRPRCRTMTSSSLSLPRVGDKSSELRPRPRLINHLFLPSSRRFQISRSGAFYSQTRRRAQSHARPGGRLYLPQHRTHVQNACLESKTSLKVGLSWSPAPTATGPPSGSTSFLLSVISAGR